MGSVPTVFLSAAIAIKIDSPGNNGTPPPVNMRRLKRDLTKWSMESNYICLHACRVTLNMVALITTATCRIWSGIPVSVG